MPACIGLFSFVGFSLAVVPILDNVYWTSVLIMVAINALLVSSIRMVFNLNEISLGQVGFSLIGAYVSALAVMKMGFSFWAGVLLGGTASALLALLLSYPFMRIKGIYFSILTFMTAEIFRLVAFNWRSVTGGQFGLTGIPGPESLVIFGFADITFHTMDRQYYLTVILVGICLLMMYTLERSHLNRKWTAIRDAESLALSVGINTMKYKAINFTIACFFAGIAGGLFAHYQGGLSASINDRFGFFTSLMLVVYLIVGGKNRFFGPVIGTIAIMVLMEVARPLHHLRPMLVGGILIVFTLMLPDGIAGLPDKLKDWAAVRFHPKSAE
jgi:branched-chain amino acid transport system permease protein